MSDLLSTYSEIRECDYKDRHYSVRDNGAIFRYPKEGCRPSKLDNIWTFGNKNAKTGYMLYGGVRVHQIVATAFHGIPEDPNMVVDHKDTNRCNNRPENLQWVTRLENALNNPYTRRRIELLCGSIEAFLKDPSKLRMSASEPNTAWMRAVSKEEAARCKKHLDRWKEEDRAHEERTSLTKSEGIGEWIFSDSPKNDFGESWDKDWISRPYITPYHRQMEEIEEMNRQHYEETYGLKDSLTPGAKQLNWAVPTEFPQCPTTSGDMPLLEYLKNLVPGVLFCHNNVYKSHVLKAELSTDGSKIAVLSTHEGVTDFALAEITFEDGYYVHESIRSFFSEEGAEKYYTISLGREWTGGDVFEDFC